MCKDYFRYDTLMSMWGESRKEIADGDVSSTPRDRFEMILECVVESCRMIAEDMGDDKISNTIWIEFVKSVNKSNV